MIPKLVCGECGGEIFPADKFCSSCGAKTDEPGTSGGPVCRLCGQMNRPQTSSCETCGASLGVSSRQNAAEPNTDRSQGTSLSLLQSWKLTVGVALLLIVTVVVLKST